MTDTPDAHAHPSEPEKRQVGEARSPRRPTPGGAAAPANGSGGSFAPAAHAHPARASAAVLEAQRGSETPGTMPSAFGWPVPAGSEPPPFGFNAPGRKEDDTVLPGSRGASAGRAGAAPAGGMPGAPTAAGSPSVEAAAPAELSSAATASLPGPPEAPTFARPSPLGSRPALAPPASQPRELMPAAIPTERRRIGETATPTFGPPGKHRSTAAMVLLSTLTLGIYAIAWHRRVNQEMADFDPRIHVHPSRSAWAVFIPWFVGLLASAAAAGMVLATHYGLDLHLPLTGHQVLPAVAALAAVQYLILLLPFSLVAVVRTAERVRMVEEHAGVTTDAQIRPAALIGWLIVPVIGGFVVMGRQQGDLNQIWDLARG